jgi:hypothetical protein
MFGNFHLRFAKNVLKVTNAKRRLCEQMQDAKPRAVAKASVNLNQVHCVIRNKPLRWHSMSHLFLLPDARERGIAFYRAAGAI